MSKRQFSKVASQHGAPMGRASYGSIPECFPHTVRLFKVKIDSQGYDDGGAYWGIGGPLWCAIGEHDTGCQSRAFIRADSREHAIVLLKIENGLLVQGPNKDKINRILFAAQWGNSLAREMIKNLGNLGYKIPYNTAENQRSKGF